MVAGGDGTARPLAGPHRPILVEGRGALDAGLVDTLGAVDVVGAAITADRAEQRGSRRGVVRAIPPHTLGPETQMGQGTQASEDLPVVLNDVVLDQRVGGPSVHTQVSVSGRVERARVVDGSGTTGVPALAGNKVATVGPLHRVGAAVAVLVVDGAAVVRPEGIVVAAVGAGRRRSAGAGHKVGYLGVVERDRHGAGGRREGGDQGGEGDHDED